jgi:hypothetical protein
MKGRRIVMEYNALIQWNDTKNYEDVIVTTNKESDEDDYIFFYFKDQDEIEQYKRTDMHEFRIVNYVPTTTKDWYYERTKINLIESGILKP